MNRRRAIAALALGALTIAAAKAPSAPTYDVWAVRYATIAGFPTRGLIAGADSTQKTDIAMMVWLAKGGGRTVLMDAGFYRDKFVQRWKPQDFVKPSDALAPLGVKPEDVTDVIISHIHWDHADGADLFPKATIWLQQEEWDYYISPTGAAARGARNAADVDDVTMLRDLDRQGRVKKIAGDGVEIIPGIRVYTGGKHTYASEYATVPTERGTVVLASDNAYLYENLERHRPIAQTLDSLSNLAAADRMKKLASDPRLIVPGHDPQIFVRFPKPGNGIAKIE
jgi:glyoxylase-like metal-dependent hydrolase (beta-lactamase superfamily II)